MKTYGLEEAAAFLNISTDTMKDMAGSGVVPGAKIGKAWVFSDELLEEYLRDEIRRQTAERRGMKREQPAAATKVQTAYTRSVGRTARTPPFLGF